MELPDYFSYVWQARMIGCHKGRFCRAWLVGVITSFSSGQHDLNVKCQRNLTQDEQKALENLRNYDDIIIKQADKGSAVVVMDREANINEAMGQLNDSEVYMLLDRDPTWDMVKRINEKIRESWEKGNIDDKTKAYLMVSEDMKPGRFHLLPKIHKQG